MLLAPMVSRMLRFFPPVVTGTFVVMLGTLLMPVGFAYWGGGFGAADFGATHHLLLGALVLVVTLGLHQYGRGIWSEAAPLIGLITGAISVDTSQPDNSGLPDLFIVQ